MTLAIDHVRDNGGLTVYTGQPNCTNRIFRLQNESGSA